MNDIVEQNPKFAIIKLYVNGDGEVVDVKDCADNPLTKEYYGEVEQSSKKFLESAILVTEGNSYCRWQLVRGVWKCV